VQIIATVVPRPDSTYPVVIKPDKLDMSQITEKVIDEYEFKIINRSDEDLEVILIADAPRFFELDLPKKIGAGESEEGQVKLLKSVLDESFEKSFTFELNDEKNSRFTVPVKRRMKSNPAVQSRKASAKRDGK
jgi:hypothetical protein